jgi:hypothetical protein
MHKTAINISTIERAVNVFLRLAGASYLITTLVIARFVS